MTLMRFRCRFDHPPVRGGRRAPPRARVGLAALGLLAACSGGDTTSPPPPAAVASITIAPDSTNVDVGASMQLNAIVRDAQGATLSGRTVSWTTSNASVATVSPGGLVTAVAAGRALITATAESRSGTAVILVTLPFDELPGEESAPAVAAVTLQQAVPRPEDYTTDHPQHGTLAVSFNTVLVSIAADATVGQINALLRQVGARIVGGVPGVADTHAAVLVLRLATRSHAELAPILVTLRAAPFVRAAAPDALLEPDVVTGTGVSTPAQWVWDRPPNGGNYGLEITRAPQTWNLNDVIRQSGARTETAVFDDGFDGHTDLMYKAALTPLTASVHGTHVAGIIGATFDNQVGVDGMNPFADLVVTSGLSVGTLVTGVAHLIAARPFVRVLNLSIGYNWKKKNVTIATDAVSQNLAVTQGAALYDALAAIAASGRALPVLVAATGNDAYAPTETQYASPYMSAALIHGAAPIIAVEAVGMSGSTVGRATFSNIGGHVSAPGVAITSTLPSNAYGPLSGTSMAAPHVTGLVSFLYSLDPLLPQPDMTTNPVRDLLLANTTPVSGSAAPMIDAFASALDVDRVRGDRRVLRGLLDIDDGTPDGNKRTGDGNDFLDDDVDGSGGPGDGVIDMSDFRRWRDWLLQAENPPDLRLDGAPDHPKKDLNGDRLVQSPALENVYPRGDFNGDGMISRADALPVSGVMAGRNATDLAVLQELFSDPEYATAALPGLLDSGDIEVDVERCTGFGPKRMLSGMKEIDTQLFRSLYTHPDTAPRFIHTIPVHPAGYTAMLEFYDQADTVAWTQEQDTTLAPGEDIFVECNLLYFNDFLASIGDEWSNPIASTTPNGRRFLGQFGNESMTLALDSLPTHDELELTFDLYIIDSWNGNGGTGATPSKADIISVSIDGVATPLLKSTFSNKPRDEQAYPDEYPGGSHPAGTGALALNALGFPTGSDFFGDSLYQIRLRFLHSEASIVLRFESQQSSGSNEQWGIDNVFLTRIR